MISFMGQDERGEKEQDEIDLALSAIGIRLKKSLTEEQIENAMDEINGIVAIHIKMLEPRGLVFSGPAPHLMLSSSSNSSNLSSKCQHHHPCKAWVE